MKQLIPPSCLYYCLYYCAHSEGPPIPRLHPFVPSAFIKPFLNFPNLSVLFTSCWDPDWFWCLSYDKIQLSMILCLGPSMGWLNDFVLRNSYIPDRFQCTYCAGVFFQFSRVFKLKFLYWTFTIFQVQHQTLQMHFLINSHNPDK